MPSDEDRPGEDFYNDDEEAGDNLQEDIGSEATDQINQGTSSTSRKFENPLSRASTQKLGLPEDDLKDRTLVVMWPYTKDLMVSTVRFPTA